MTLIDKAEALAERAMARASERYNGCKPHFSVKDADLMAMLAATLAPPSPPSLRAGWG